MKKETDKQREVKVIIHSRFGDQETTIRRQNKIRRLERFGRYKIGFGAVIHAPKRTN